VEQAVIFYVDDILHLITNSCSHQLFPKASL